MRAPAASRLGPRVPEAPSLQTTVREIEAKRPRSFWSLFWLEPAFGKRVAFASLMTLAILGTYLISHETEYSTGPSNPAAIMAQQAPGENPDTMLATLASYQP